MADHRYILAMVREDDFKHDPWGTALSWHFSIADLLTEWAPPYPPASWEFRQGLGGSDTEAFAYRELAPMLEAGELTADNLKRAGDILHRYESMLQRAGRDY